MVLILSQILATAAQRTRNQSAPISCQRPTEIPKETDPFNKPYSPPRPAGPKRETLRDPGRCPGSLPHLSRLGPRDGCRRPTPSGCPSRLSGREGFLPRRGCTSAGGQVGAGGAAKPGQPSKGGSQASRLSLPPGSQPKGKLSLLQGVEKGVVGSTPGEELESTLSS